MTAHHRLQVLRSAEPPLEPSAVPEDQRERPDHARDAGLVLEDHAELGEVDLRPAAGQGLEPALERFALRRPRLAKEVGHPAMSHPCSPGRRPRAAVARARAPDGSSRARAVSRRTGRSAAHGVDGARRPAPPARASGAGARSRGRARPCARWPSGSSPCRFTSWIMTISPSPTTCTLPSLPGARWSDLAPDGWRFLAGSADLEGSMGWRVGDGGASSPRRARREAVERVRDVRDDARRGGERARAS